MSAIHVYIPPLEFTIFLNLLSPSGPSFSTGLLAASVFVFPPIFSFPVRIFFGNAFRQDLPPYRCRRPDAREVLRILHLSLSITLIQELDSLSSPSLPNVPFNCSV